MGLGKTCCLIECPLLFQYLYPYFTDVIKGITSTKDSVYLIYNTLQAAGNIKDSKGNEILW